MNLTRPVLRAPRRAGLRVARRAGLRVPRHSATTAHLSAIYPFHTNPGPGPRGIYVGDNISGGGTPWCFDPFQAYADGVITSPNIVVLGMVGSGKSSAIKTYLYRSIGLLGTAGTPRWCGILDPKGEYGPLADALGLTKLSLRPGGTVRLNPLDAGPATNTADIEGLRARRTRMVTTLAAAVLHRDLRPLEDAAVGWAIDHLTPHTNQPATPPTLAEVIGVLMHPTRAMNERAALGTNTALAREIADVRHGLGKLLDGPLRGMFDGPTTNTVNWGGRGVVVDLSAVHTNPDALTAVMVATMGWFQTLLTSGDPNVRRVQVWEEVWALLGQERTAKYFQSCQKLSRDYGVANISVAHRIADLRAQAGDGTAAAKVATGLLADTQTRVLFRQPADQIGETTETLGLTQVEADIVSRLTQGRALWHLGDHRAVIQHRIAPAEWAITQTDANLAV